MAEQFSVRLVDEDGNTDTSYGNVHVMHLGLWGSVYDTYWQFSDANVVCRQLNYAYALRATRCVSVIVLYSVKLFCVYSGSSFGAGITLVWMDSVQCNGTETSLKNCAFAGFGVTPLQTRIKYNSAGVVCFSEFVPVFVCLCLSAR